MKYFGYAILGIISIGLVSVVGIGLKIAFFPVQTAGNLVNTAYDASSQTLNAQNAIYNYEWFKQTLEDINAQKIQFTNSQASLDSFEVSAGDRVNWTFEDKTEDSRLRAVVLGIQNGLQQTIADYNAHLKEANRNIFLNGIVPDYIDALTFIKK